MYVERISKEEELTEELSEFLIELADHEENHEEKIEKAFEYMERSRTWYKAENIRQFSDYIFSLCEGRREYILYHLKALINCSEYLSNGPLENEEEALSYCIRANNLYEENQLTDEYWYSRIHKRIGECYACLNGYDYDQAMEEKQKCNYWLLAKKEAEGKNAEKQAELWRSSADEYRYLDNFAMERDCYEKVLSILTPVLNQYDYNSFQNYWYAAEGQLRCYEQLHDREQVRERGMDLYDKTADHYRREMQKEEDKEALGWYAWDFGGKIRICADYLSKAEGSVLYMIAIMVVASWENVSEEVLRNVRKYAEREWVQLFEAFFHVLHSRTAEKNIDNVLMVYEGIKPVLEEDSRLKRFDDEVKWFLKEYQNREIEFKR